MIGIYAKIFCLARHKFAFLRSEWEMLFCVSLFFRTFDGLIYITYERVG